MLVLARSKHSSPHFSPEKTTIRQTACINTGGCSHGENRSACSNALVNHTHHASQQATRVDDRNTVTCQKFSKFHTTTKTTNSTSVPKRQVPSRTTKTQKQKHQTKQKQALLLTTVNNRTNNYHANDGCTTYPRSNC